MYAFVRLSNNHYKRLSGIAKKRNTTPAALGGALIAQFLSGRLVYATAEKGYISPSSSLPSDEPAPNAASSHE